ncbi:MAG TPA: hypothetical protein ENJ11_07035 [Gammaproteobacteria bacterium]|nr:hypothetical protein [Gammaproteobacteria bacterium]
MDNWMQILWAIGGILLLFMILPGVKASMQKSREAEESHWGTVILLAVVVMAFVMLLVYSVQS